MRTTGFKYLKKDKEPSGVGPFTPTPGVGPGHYKPQQNLVIKKCLNYTFSKTKYRSVFQE